MCQRIDAAGELLFRPSTYRSMLPLELRKTQTATNALTVVSWDVFRASLENAFGQLPASHHLSRMRYHVVVSRNGAISDQVFQIDLFREAVVACWKSRWRQKLMTQHIIRPRFYDAKKTALINTVNIKEPQRGNP
jgi:hypothetical protein